jgi:hypothetical protein
VTIEDSLKSAEGRRLIAKLSSAFDINDRNANTAVEALERELRARIERTMLSRGGVADVLSLVTKPTATRVLSSEPGNLASQDSIDSGNRILDVLIGNKHISRKIAARAASEAGLETGTVAKLLPVVASLMIGQLQQQSKPALEKLLQNVPGLAGAGGSPLPLPDRLPNANALYNQGPDYGAGSNGSHQAPRGPIDAGPPLPLPGDNIPGLGRRSQRLPDAENPYERLPDIVRRGGGRQMPGGGSLDEIIRSIFGNLLGRNRGVIGTMIQLFLIRWLASIARRILTRVLRSR